MKVNHDKSLHIAPMLDVTNREFRQLMRILSTKCVLWTEMVVDETIIHTEDLGYHLDYDDNSHPIVCQIGGNTPDMIYKACETVIEHGYDEIDINMDCPSNRVAGKRQFGAVLMKKFDVAEGVVEAMHKASIAHNNIPISVKCRVGIDEFDSFDFMVQLIERLSPYCKIFYLHARKCVLGGILTPAQNRAVPPLNYPRMYQLCRRFPDIDFYLNGGIPDLKSAKELCFGNPDVSHETNEIPCSYCKFSNGSCVAPLAAPPPNLKGCQLGRTARDNPCVLWDIDRYFYGLDKNPCQNRREVLEKYCAYLTEIYPRRCCDLDPSLTSKIPKPGQIQPEYDFCPTCASFYPNTPEMTIAPADYTQQGSKFTSHVLHRCARPIWGIFFGLPKARAFRRELDSIITKDMQTRNCGPTIVIRKALRVIPDELLDEPFVRTEDLKETPSNHLDSIDGCCRVKKRW